MSNLAHVRGAGRALFWGRMSGTWGKPEMAQLLVLIDSLGLAPGSRVVLDFAEAEHVDFRAVPLLIHLGLRLERRRADFHLAGVSDYLRQIVEVECALDGREFIERHLWHGSSRPDSRGRVDQADGLGQLRRLHPDELAVPSPN